MRKIIVGLALMVLLLTLGACGEEEPTPTPPPVETEPVVVATSGEVVVTQPQPTPEQIVATAEPVQTPEAEAPPTEPQALRTRLLNEFNLGVPAGNTYTPRSLAIHAGLGRLYARTTLLGIGAPGLVTMIDLASGKVLAVVETGLDSYVEGSLIVDEARDRVYAVNSGENTCTVLDAATLAPLTTLEGAELVALDLEGGRLVVAGDARLRVLDAADHSLMAELELSPDDRLLAMAIGPAGAGSEEVRVALARRDATTVVLGLHEPDDLALMNYAILSGTVDYLAADPAGYGWYATGNNGVDNTLWILDEKAYLLEERALGDWTEQTPLAIDPVSRRLFLGRQTYPDYRLSIFDLDSGEFTDHIPVDVTPYALAWDPAGGRLLVSDTYNNQIGVVAVDAPADPGEAAIWPTAIQIVDLEVDPVRSHMYATDTRGRLRTLDSVTGELLADLPGEGLLSLDADHDRLYAGGLGGERVRIFDTTALEQTGEIRSGAIPVADPFNGGLYLVQRGVYMASLDTLTVTGVISDTLPPNEGFSYNPTAVDAAIDPGSGRVFAIITNGVPGSNGGTYLYVYEPLTYQKVLTDTERSPWYLDIDPMTGDAFVSRAHLAGAATSRLVDGRTYTARMNGLFGSLRVDPGLGIVFLTTGSEGQTQVWMLDSTKLDVVDSVRMPGSFTLYALDPVRHWLYVANRDGRVQVWSALGGDPPRAYEPALANIARAGPDRLFLPPGEETIFAKDGNYELYVSADEGASWAWVGAGLPAASVLDVAFSPAYGAGGTLLVALANGAEGYGIWRSEDGGRLWQVSSSGLTDLQVGRLAISPGYEQDLTIFATAQRGGLFRSIDGGENWLPLSDHYRPPDTYDEPVDDLVLAPSFGQGCEGCDTLFVNQYGLQRSTDGGDTWEAVETGVPGYGRGIVAFSPGYATDRSLLYFWIPSQAEVEVQVYRSVDGGDTWQPAGEGPAVENYGQGRALVAPDGTLIFLWGSFSGEVPTQAFRTDLAGLAGPGGLVWEQLAGDPLQAATPLELSADGTSLLALDEDGRLLRWQVDDLDWQAQVPEVEPEPPTPEPPTPEPPTPVPTTPPPIACAVEPDRYRGVWQAVRANLGCPAGEGSEVALAEQAFERGRMIWHSETLTIYVMSEDGNWAPYDDTWQEGVDPPWDAALPPPPQQPQRGFGKVWREELGGPAAAIGWALANERAVDGWVQPFDGGLLIWTDTVMPGSGGEGTATILYGDGTWQAISTPVSGAAQPPEPTEAVACDPEPVEFRTVWLSVRERLGCPSQASAAQVFFAEQPFEYGSMLWDSETAQVLVLRLGGTWQAFDDTWVEGVDPAWDPALPPPPQQPQRGFGKVWREELGGPEAAIGWALEGERGVDAWRQRFENGLLVWTDTILPGQASPGAVYLLYDDGSWEAKASPGP